MRLVNKIYEEHIEDWEALIGNLFGIVAEIKST